VCGVGLLLGSLALLAALGEVSVRLCPSGILPDEVQQWLADDLGVYDPSVGTLVQPYHTGVFAGREFKAQYHTDDHGFRNAQPWPAVAEIVVVGDAVVFGYGVEDDQGWPTLLAHAMTPTRVINLGLLEGGPQQYARVYATFGTGLHPKLVLVGLTMADDFRDAELFDRWEHEDSGESYRPWREGQDLLGSWPHSLHVLPALVARYSCLYQVLRASYRHAQTSSQVVWLLGWGHLQVRPHRLTANPAQAQPERPGFQLVLLFCLAFTPKFFLGCWRLSPPARPEQPFCTGPTGLLVLRAMLSL